MRNNEESFANFKNLDDAVISVCALFIFWNSVSCIILTTKEFLSSKYDSLGLFHHSKQSQNAFIGLFSQRITNEILHNCKSILKYFSLSSYLYYSVNYNRIIPATSLDCLYFNVFIYLIKHNILVVLSGSYNYNYYQLRVLKYCNFSMILTQFQFVWNCNRKICNVFWFRRSV